jgi:hypothetical protein
VISQQSICGDHCAFRQRGANARRGNGLVTLIHQVQRLHGKTQPLALALEEKRRAAALATEMEIGPGNHAANAQPVHENGLDEVLCLGLREHVIEGQNDDAIQPERLGQPGLGIGLCQPEHEWRRREHIARMRLECQQQGRHALGPRPLAQGGDNGLVATMQPIEIADGDKSAPQVGGQVGEAGKTGKGHLATRTDAGDNRPLWRGWAL